MPPTLYLFKQAAILSWLCISILFFGCGRHDKPVVQPVDQLTIERVSIAGIPSSNIKIDQTRKEITIQVPTAVSKVDLPVSYTVGCKDCLVAGIPNSLYLCNALNSWSVSRPGQQPVVYTVVLQPAGPLTSGLSSSPFVYRIGSDYLTLPILNYYDGQQNSIVTFRSLDTGVAEATSEIHCLFDSLNWFRVAVYASLPPGTYTVDVTKENGRQMQFPQRLQVVKGLPRISYPSILRLNMPRILLNGFNLYSEDNIEVLFKESRGSIVQVKPVSYGINGTSVEVLTPSTLKTGYYSVQLIQNGQEVPLSGNQIIAIESNQQPYLYGIYIGSDYKPGPVTLTRGATYPISISTYSNGPDTQVLLKLVNVNITAPNVLVPVRLPNDYFLGATEGTGVSVTIPQTVPPGRYMIYPRFQSGSDVVDGLLYGWEFDIQ